MAVFSVTWVDSTTGIPQISGRMPLTAVPSR